MLVNDGYGCGYGEGDAAFPSNLVSYFYVPLHFVRILLTI